LPRRALHASSTITSSAMADIIPSDEQSNYETFRDCLSEPVLKSLAAPIEKPKPKKKRHAKKNSKEKNALNGKSKPEVTTSGNISNSDMQTSDAEDLGEFIEVRHANLCLEPPTDSPSTSAVSYSPAYLPSYAPCPTQSSETRPLSKIPIQLLSPPQHTRTS
jgi:hypothetical protein